MRERERERERERGGGSGGLLVVAGSEELIALILVPGPFAGDHIPLVCRLDRRQHPPSAHHILI
jgi:hypothetical protein